MKENVLVIEQNMLKYISLYLNTVTLMCPSLGLYLGSEKDAILSKTIRL